MERARRARTDEIDEIPVAQRILKLKSISSKKITFIKVLLFFSFLITFLSSSFVFKRYLSSNKDIVQVSKILKNESLLGHLKYDEISKEDLANLYPGFQVHKDTLSALRKMREAAASDGVFLVFLSGYRSISLQNEIFYENKSIRNQIAIERARVSAPPGYSEHSTGYAIDIGDRDRPETDFEISFENTPSFQWLKNNAAKYHFILSFPKNNLQNVSYEPWHWRYEGTVEALRKFEAANKLRSSN